MSKTIHKNIILITVVLWGILFSHGQSLAQSPITATVDRYTLSVDEQLSLTVTVTGDFFDIPVPNLSNLGDFMVLDKQFSVEANIVKGQLLSQWLFVYRLQPLREGHLVIDSIEVDIQGQSFHTDPISIEVTAPTVLPPDNNIPLNEPPNLLNEQDFFIEAEIDNATPYLGQQIIYTFRLYQATTFLGQPDYHPPAFTNFWSQTILSQPHYQTNIEGRHYFVTEVRTAVFPAMLGTIIIGPAKLIIPLNPMNPEKTLETEPITVQVKSLPKGAPASFKGAVGQFEIRASLSQTEGRVNEPLTLNIEIEGTGNIEFLTEPTEPELPNWRVFASKPSTKVAVQEDGVYGIRRFERLIFPSQEGEYKIPSIEFSYYDPKANEYRTIKTNPIPITVVPGETDPPDTSAKGEPIGLRASDIRPLKPIPNNFSSTRSSLTSNLLYGFFWVLPLFIMSGAWIFHKRQQRFQEDVSYARRQRAYQVAMKTLGEAKKDGVDSYALVQRTLLGYLSDKLNHPTVGLTHEELIALLRESQFEAPFIQRIQAILNQLELNRFAPVGTSAAQALIIETKELINQLEKQF